VDTSDRGSDIWYTKSVQWEEEKNVVLHTVQYMTNIVYVSEFDNWGGNLRLKIFNIAIGLNKTIALKRTLTIAMSLYISMHAHVNARSASISMPGGQICVCVHVCIHVCVHVYVCVHIRGKDLPTMSLNMNLQNFPHPKITERSIVSMEREGRIIVDQ
jgi:hypothetical protein